MVKYLRDGRYMTIGELKEWMKKQKVKKVKPVSKQAKDKK